MILESKKANVLQALNDCTLLILTYNLWCFTDIVWEPETRERLGYVYVAFCLSNISVHLVIMLSESFYRIKLSFKRCINRKKAK